MAGETAFGPMLIDGAIAEGARRARLSCKAGTSAYPLSRDVPAKDQQAESLPASEIPHVRGKSWFNGLAKHRARTVPSGFNAAFSC